MLTNAFIQCYVLLIMIGALKMKHYIALADCDCFFVSAERAFNRRLEGIPVAVLSNNDGCVVSRSKEAKALGLKMGEPYFMARPRLPNILYVRANHDLYHATSEKVMSMFKSFTPVSDTHLTLPPRCSV